MAVGIALCLCGLLDSPVNSLVSKVDYLLESGWTLPIAAVCYGFLMIADCIVLWLAGRLHRSSFKKEQQQTDQA
ncbi:hypothetical protein CALCODRAFT_486189 [Calocera cornea HHB12733]|uniref:Uncharacterized protein n=1 Tax=Calocera cornea HHB12733 TaxID=1353952 RepID=A0A165DW22_9BASI|nr:hypothetical protein CALCODRAFT_486189 [Calocera cornea HHB12733]